MAPTHFDHHQRVDPVPTAATTSSGYKPGSREAIAGIPPFDTAPTVDDDINSWKVHRRVKYQRDLMKRGTMSRPHQQSGLPMEPSSKPRVNSHGTSSHRHQHGTRGSPPDHHESRGRMIPGARRKEKMAPSSPLLLSKSVPSARSWPLDQDARELMEDQTEENLDPNWSLSGHAPLATSAPEGTSFLSRSYGSKREARTMTLFESAMLFNEAGNMLSHDNFHELGTSPDFSPAGSRRKSKRRVGRHKPEKKKFDVDDHHLSSDDVVLELMHVLLPEMDVTKELNMKFLGGSRHHGDVFDFDDDDVVERPGSGARSSSGCKQLEVDVVKFQASLTKLLFNKDEPHHELPTVGTPSSELVEEFITSEWIVKSILQVIKLDVIAQYDAFVVMLAVFRTIPDQRRCMLKAAVSGCLAIYDHQSMERLNDDDGDRKCVSMKGIIAFLNAVLIEIEKDCAENPDVFGDNPDAIDSTINEFCDQVLDAMKLLARSSPGQTSKSDDKKLEKYEEGSESVEATTYSAMGAVLCHLTSFSPIHGQEFLSWMLRKWPQRNVQLQLFFVRFIAGILTQFMLRGVLLPPVLVSRVFSRLRSCIQSPHFMIAKEASSVCGNLPLMDMYLSRDRQLREQVSAALHVNATSHWNDRIRQISDEYFDLLLDFA